MPRKEIKTPVPLIGDNAQLEDYELTEDELAAYRHFFPLEQGESIDDALIRRGAAARDRLDKYEQKDVSQEGEVETSEGEEEEKKEHPYSANNITIDKDWVRRGEEMAAQDLAGLKQNDYRRYELMKNINLRGELLEAICRQEIFNGEWMGPDCEVVTTECFDDRENHTDLVLEWPGDDGEVVRLAVDITYSGDPRVFGHKIHYVQDGIESGKLTTLKYFESDLDEEVGPAVSGIPRVVLGTSHDEVKRLSTLFRQAYDKEKEPDTVKRNRKKQELCHDVLGLEFLNIARVQLERGILDVLSVYAGKLRTFTRKIKNKPDIEAYQEILDKATRVSADKDLAEMDDLLADIDSHQELFSIMPSYDFMQITTSYRNVLKIIDKLIQDRNSDPAYAQANTQAHEDMGRNGTYLQLVSAWPESPAYPV